MTLLLPGVGATIYGSLPRDLDTPAGREVIRNCDHVTLHTAADAGDVRNAALVRQLGCQRVWLALPGNYLSRLDLSRGRAAAVAEIRRCARVALDMGAEILELNCEGASDGRVVGDWTSAPGDAAEAARLGSLAVDLLDAARAVLTNRCALAFTSHDMPGFRIPWGQILSRVDVHSPQHYPAQAGRTVQQAELAGRVERSRGRWEALVDRGEVPAVMTPRGEAWAPYYQGHGHAVGALVWGLAQASIARLWAHPGSWSPEAVPALRLARILRAQVGFGADAIEGWQQRERLTVDGVCGPATLRSLEARAG